MNKELYVSSTPHETKVALLEDDQLAEVFFERENEYTLAGSIYKGRVTRVLPGMQSAFVDIGLERDAFLYVSDFIEVAGEEGDEEFGEIPASRSTVDVRYQPQPQQAEGDTVEADTKENLGPVADDFAPPDSLSSADDAVEGDGAADGEDTETAEGARRWRGRRRRRGRRGRGDEQYDRPQQHSEPARRESANSTPGGDFGPPPGYTPIVLPGESISKYRSAPQQTTADENMHREQHERTRADDVVSAIVSPEPYEASSDGNQYRAETLWEQPQPAKEPQRLEWEVGNAPLPREQQPADRQDQWLADHSAKKHASEGPSLGGEQETENPEQEIFAKAKPATRPEGSELKAEDFRNEVDPDRVDQDEEVLTSFVANHVAEQVQPDQEPHMAHERHVAFPLHEAPSMAPEGRTLEHETLEDDELDFHPVPEDLEALSEAAADSDLDLIEETLDAEDGFGDRWIPKVADVDEEEVIAAEMLGETMYDDGEDEADDFAEEETNDHAELRATTPTAAYQQRQSERPGYDRRGQRGRRGGRRNNIRPRGHSHRPQPLITDLLKEGQEVLIQIAKEPIGKKGARITSHIALPGRFLVYMPTVNHVGVSRKISSDEERQRLKRIVTSERENGIGGFIVRTAAANIKEEDLRADIRFLKHLWAEIKSRAENSKAPALIYHDLNLVERVLRDQVNADFSQIWVDTEDEYERVVRFANRFQPSLVRRIKLYTKDTPLFEQFGIQEEINRSLKSKVWLKSGGYIVINQTEALVAIDINTGKYVGKTQRLEDTIVKTNVDAIKEIVRQIRLRDLGGIIVIDFIDMDERKNRQKVMQALEEALRNDRAPSKVLQFNDFGLVAITRKRVKQSLERTLGEPCPYCTGAGFVKSVPTVCNEIYIEMRKMIKEHERKDVTLRVHPEVAKALKVNNGKLISEMEELIGKAVLVKSDPMLHQENFDIH